MSTHPIEDFLHWLAARGGIAHRDAVRAARHPTALIRAAVRTGRARAIGRSWFVLPDADADLVHAAETRARVSCVSLAQRRGWWMPEGTPDALHVHKLPGSGAARAIPPREVVQHWAAPLTPPAPGILEASVLDALAQIAVCRPREEGLVLWESAARVEGLSVLALRAIRWTSVAARELAASVQALSDSGLETLLAEPLRRGGLPVQQQAFVAGRFVDLLIGERLVVQIDGYEFHATGSAQRASDIAHDAELRLQGYTVLRFSYHQVVRDRARVERTIRLAVAQGLHRVA